MHSGSFCPRVASQVRTADAVQRAIGALAGGEGTLMVHEQRAWSSITFQGTRHKLTYAFDGTVSVEHGERLIEQLPDYEFSIPRQLVADAAIVSVDHSLARTNMIVELELLLLDED